MDIAIGRLKLVTEGLGGVQSQLAIAFNQLEQGGAVDELYLAGSGCLCRQLAGVAADDRTQALRLSRFGDLQDEHFAFPRSGGMFHSSRAQNESASRQLSFDKQDGAVGISAQVPDCAEGFEYLCRQAAEPLAFPQSAGGTVFDNG